jgi:hypothetical protein
VAFKFYTFPSLFNYNHWVGVCYFIHLVHVLFINVRSRFIPLVRVFIINVGSGFALKSEF